MAYAAASASATYATSAGSVAWTNITGKPNLFTTYSSGNNLNRNINFEDSNGYNGIIYINSDSDGGTTTGFWSNFGSVLNISNSAASWQFGVDSNNNIKFRARWWSGGGGNWTDWNNLTNSTPGALNDASITSNVNSGYWRIYRIVSKSQIMITGLYWTAVDVKIYSSHNYNMYYGHIRGGDGGVTVIQNEMSGHGSVYYGNYSLLIETADARQGICVEVIYMNWTGGCSVYATSGQTLGTQII